MAYTVLARRYRAASFGQVIGQDPIGKTLRNAIATGRVAHAFLFTGTRGVGKTSMARILARALNAPDTVEDCPKPDESGGPLEPIDPGVQQRMADAIMRGEDLNVIEIDVASNNSVEQARQLIANAGLAPTDQARFKIYIIDEVHMLSTSAFNALLKTMEEPPDHVKFILCTTESHKVPATIQSRCQRFDFRNISTSAIADHLQSVLAAESVGAEEEVVWQLARLGNGSMRDALSLLDRLIAGGEQPLSAALLEQMLGLPPQDMVVRLVDAIADGNVAGTLEAASALHDGGIGHEQLIDVLIERLRQLMLAAACGVDSPLLELSEQARAMLAKQAERFDTSALVYMIALCENLQQAGKRTSNQRALLDATMVRLALAEKMADVTALLSGGPASLPAAPSTGTKKKEEALVADRAPVSAAPTAPTAPSTRPVAPEPPRPAPAPEAPVSPGPPPATPPTAAATDPKAIWQEILSMVADKPSLSWVLHMDLLSLEGGMVRVRPQPGHRDLVSFASQQGARLAELFQQVLKRQVRVKVDDSEAAAAEAGPGPAVQAAEGRVDQKTAMSLPMVKQVLNAFDATVIDTRPLE